MKEKNQVSSPKWRAHNTLQTSDCRFRRNCTFECKISGSRDQRIKPKFPVISHSRVTRRGREGDGSWHVERNYDVKEDARVLDGKNSVGQREIKEERKLDVVAEETAPRTFIRRIRNPFPNRVPNEKFGEFWWRLAQWENEKRVIGEGGSLKEFRFRFKRF